MRCSRWRVAGRGVFYCKSFIRFDDLATVLTVLRTIQISWLEAAGARMNKPELTPVYDLEEYYGKSDEAKGLWRNIVAKNPEVDPKSIDSVTWWFMQYNEAGLTLPCTTVTRARDGRMGGVVWQTRWKCGYDVSNTLASPGRCAIKSAKDTEKTPESATI
ncbi:hypothetical protein SeMB42_g06551 [Synchytrium endobioticum]|uniref:Uncharacterized protein n=1 Tax=Synchytrium endobioticum TaxID=286115 RepID=A0A507CHV8_9FUNG|nr:hypothetical protein SeMB42_g06551 [Synchytrium endobioticum]